MSRNPRLEEHWRQRWMDAKLKLELAHTEVTKRHEQMNGMAAPDGFFAYGKALEMESNALAEYARVLKLYTDLVIHGIAPSIHR